MSVVSASFTYSIFRLIIVILIIVGVSSTSSGAPLTYMGATPSDALSSFSLSGGSLHTGQFSQSFPIYTISAPGGIAANIALTYSSDVHRTVELENRDAQASWVGLGFDLSFPSIYVEHNFTAWIGDDRYFLVGGGGAGELVQDNLLPVANLFRSKDNSLNRFERLTTGEGNDERVIGWRVITEDGTVSIFGDSAIHLEPRNATCYVNRWGNLVGGIGKSGDSLYPYRWNLRRIQDIGGDHFVDYYYGHELSYVNDTLGGQTTFPYTRYSYISKIQSSAGQTSVFKVVDREDYQAFLGTGFFEYYSTKRLREIDLVGPLGDTLSRTFLNYGNYLNNAKGASWKKLMLSNVLVCTGDLTDTLPPTRFGYQLSDTVALNGRLATIDYPAGSRQCINYKLLSDTANFTELNRRVNDSMWFDPWFPYEQYWSVSRNSIVHTYGVETFDPAVPSYYAFQLGSWDGYWQWTNLPWTTYRTPFIRDKKSCFVASDNFVALYRDQDTSFMIYENRSGTWHADSVDAITGGNQCFVYAGNQCFIAVFGIWEDDPAHPDQRGLYALRADLYLKTPSGWERHNIKIYDQSHPPRFSDVEMGNSVFVVKCTDGSAVYGGIDYVNDSLVIGSGGYTFKAGLNYLSGYRSIFDPNSDSSIITVLEFNGNSFVKDSFYVLGNVQKMVPQLGGPVFLTVADTSDHLPGPSGPQYVTRLYWTNRTQQGWSNGLGFHEFPGGNAEIVASAYGSVALRTTIGGANVRLYSWNGTTMEFTDIFTNPANQYVNVVLSDELFVGYNTLTDELWAKRRLSTGAWGPLELLYGYVGLENHLDFDAARGLVVACAEFGAGQNITSVSRLAFRWNGVSWDTINISSNCPEDRHLNVVAYADRIVVYPRQWSYQTNWGSPEASLFQVSSGQFLGKPKQGVVSKLAFLANGANTTDSVFQVVDYDGGLASPGVYGVRFNKVITSERFRAGEIPTHHSIKRFYNDLCATLWGMQSHGFPILSNDHYLIDVVGNYFDGLEYVSCDSLTSPPTGFMPDSSVSQFSVETFGSKNCFPRPLLMNQRTRVDGISSSVALKYDNKGRLASRYTNMHDGITRVDTTVWAFMVANDPQPPSRPAARISYFVKDSVTQFVSRTRDFWRPDGILDSSYTWFDASNNTLDELETPIDYHYVRNLDTCSFNDIDTFLIANPRGISCEYQLNFHSDHLNEYAVIKKFVSGLWIAVDSLPSVFCFGGGATPPVPECPNTILVSKFGSFAVSPGDSIKVILGNQNGHGNECSFGDAWVNFVEPERWVRGKGAITFKQLPASINFGRDTHNNLVSWMGASHDTSSAKYSPDGNMQLVSIRNGFANNSFFFDAEYDFDANGNGYDGWKLREPAYTSMLPASGFTGDRSLKIHGLPVPSGGSYLYKKIVRDSLVRNMYVLSLWYNGNGGRITVNAYNGSTTSTVLTTPLDVTSVWTRRLQSVDLTNYRTSDSIKICIGIMSLFGTVYLDDIRFHPLDAVVSTSTFDKRTGVALTASGPDNIPIRSEYDSFFRPVRLRNYKGELLQQNEFYYSARDPLHGGTYSPSAPNYVKTTTYLNDTLTPTSISYFDGAGRTIESRSLTKFDGTMRTLVSGHATSNSNGQAVRSFLPYIDLFGATGLMDFSDTATMTAETNQFYNGTSAPDCGGFPFAEHEYEPQRGRLKKSAGPGLAYNMASGRSSQFDFATKILGNDTLAIATSTDPDNLKSINAIHSSGKFEKSVSYWLRPTGAADSIITKTTTNPMTQYSEMTVDTGIAQSAPSILLRKSWTNDRGMEDSTWKVDYGKVRMIYDDHGNLRFMQNDLRKAEGVFVYFKYDALGRKTEEGVVANSTKCFNDSCAMIRSFPTIEHNPTPHYRWHYDYYTSGNTTLFAPGKLVRVESGNLSFFRQFYYNATGFSDSALVQLDPTLTTKWLKHYYNRDGSLLRFEVLPNSGLTTGQRKYSYSYDIAGRLEKITNALSGLGQQDHVTYSYNADGSLRRTLYGVYVCNQGGCSPYRYDTLQQIDYTYNAIGSLIGINNTNAVSGALTSYGAANDHFASLLQYHEASPPNYFNGRVSRVKSVNSKSASGTSVHDYRFQYNDLGWLSRADDQSGNNVFDETYDYNALGQRKRVTRNPFGTPIITDYTYSTTAPGSSRLRSITGMGTYKMWYDSLGNLLADTSRQLYEMKYDYRNLMGFARVAATNSAPYTSQLVFTYDESGQRIAKGFLYYIWNVNCQDPDPLPTPDMVSPGPGEESLMLSGSESLGNDSGGGMTTQSSSGGGSNCWLQVNAKSFYLYDGNALVATFDATDNVVDMFVNSPTGLVASYSANNDAYLNYYITDHLGSTRVLMRGAPSSTYQVVQYNSYYPFGQDLEAWGSTATPYKFTGKERDVHSSFAFDYFGARYYDPRIGQFSSVDAAGQFASGYVYGGNNPVSGVDPDGNLFFLAAPFLAGAAMSFVSYTISYDLQHNGDYKNFDYGKAFAHALVGGLTGYVSQWGQPAHLAKNMGYSMAVSSASGAINSTIDGRAWNVSNSLLMGAASGVLTSQHFDNFMTGHGFRSYDSEIGKMLNNGEYLRAWNYVADKYSLDVSGIDFIGKDEDRTDLGFHTYYPETQKFEVGIGTGLFKDGKYFGHNSFVSTVKHELNHNVQFKSANVIKYSIAAQGLMKKEGDVFQNQVNWDYVELPSYNSELAFANRSGISRGYQEAIQGVIADNGLPFKHLQGALELSRWNVWFRYRPNSVFGAINAIY